MRLEQRKLGADLAIGLGLVAIAIVIAGDTWSMRVPPSYARVGPQVFPALIAAGLAIIGAVLVWRAWRGIADALEEPGASDWTSVAVIAAGLILHLNLLKPLGFVPAGLILFLSVTFAFGSRKYVRDIVVGLVLTVATYAGFTYGLGLELPPGILKGML